MDTLNETRDEISRIDKELIQLLGDRMHAVRQAGAHKARNGDLPLRDPERERALFAVWAKEGGERGLSAYFLGRILREVLAWSRRDQERFLIPDGRPDGTAAIRVAIPGGKGSYSDLAARKLFEARGETVRASSRRTFTACLDALEAAEVDYALLPVENTISGSIDEVYALLGRRRLHVVDEEVWRVEHCLAVLPGVRPEQLRTVRSHPVALQQCERFLSSLVGARAEFWSDTANAAASVAEAGDTSIGALCSEEAARRAGLEVIAEDVADARHNQTRFLLVGPTPRRVDPRVPARTSLVLTVAHRDGALADVLSTFAKAGVNLSKLESRPQPDSPWEYLFYVDVDGNAAEAPLRGALEEVRRHSHHLRVLGTYPRRAGVGVDPIAREVLPPLEPAPDPIAEVESTCRITVPAVAAPPNGKDAPVNGSRTRIRVKGIEIGPDTFTLIAGPCAVESRAQIHDAAEMVRAHGAHMLRGGAFKPRTSPYAFQGLGFEGLAMLAEAGEAFELPIVTEVLRVEDVERVAELADVLQVGARNMQNAALLTAVGRTSRPVLLKRGMSATIDELLLATEYILDAGNHQIILCERGIRTFETATRNTLDISAVPVLKERTHLPILVDPSHAAGRRSLVLPLALAAAAAGADGLIVEAHPRPEEALCDKDQALVAEDLALLQRALIPILSTRVGR